MKLFKIIFITILLCFFLEIFAITVFYYKSATKSYKFGTLWLANNIANQLDRYIALRIGNKNIRFDKDQIVLSPSTSIEIRFSNYLKDSYKKEFESLNKILQKRNIPIIILWIPTNKSKKINNSYQKFFQELSEKNNLPFISFIDLLKFPREKIYLEPYNDHLTRFSNIFIANKINEYIKNNNFKKKGTLKCDEINGMFKKNKREIFSIIPEVPYLMQTDQFGFRSSLPEKFSKEKSTILIVGDSFTFGPYLSSYDTYPAILNSKLNNWNIINGGVSSFSIKSERYLIENNLKCLNPSIVILQVLDNDIADMAASIYNEYNFKNEIIEITDLEKLFYENLN